MTARSASCLRALLVLAGASLCLVILAAGAGWFWFFGRPQPANLKEQLYPGVIYQRISTTTPRPIVFHVVSIDLRQENISFLVTPGDPGADLPLKARTTSQFLDEFHQQVAINGDGFTPWYSNSLLDYYPHTGDAVKPIGLAVSRGVTYSPPNNQEPTLYLSRTNQASFKSPTGRLYHAISGNAMLVEQGRLAVQQPDQPQPRSAVALDRRGRTLMLIVVDGRQPNYSEGVTLEELAQFILQQGGFTAMNLDGGGSATLVVQDSRGRSRVLNSPIDNHIPGRERPVGNHLGVSIRR